MITNNACGRRAQSPNIFCGANKATRISKCVKAEPESPDSYRPRMCVPYFRYSRVSARLDTHTEDVGMTAIVRRVHGDLEGSDRVVPWISLLPAMPSKREWYLSPSSNGRLQPPQVVSGS
jgi:hypothetical protein